MKQVSWKVEEGEVSSNQGSRKGFLGEVRFRPEIKKSVQVLYWL